jgi:hypothetical protein
VRTREDHLGGQQLVAGVDLAGDAALHRHRVVRRHILQLLQHLHPDLELRHACAQQLLVFRNKAVERSAPRHTVSRLQPQQLSEEIVDHTGGLSVWSRIAVLGAPDRLASDRLWARARRRPASSASDRTRACASPMPARLREHSGSRAEMASHSCPAPRACCAAQSARPRAGLRHLVGAAEAEGCSVTGTRPQQDIMAGCMSTCCGRRSTAISVGVIDTSETPH